MASASAVYGSLEEFYAANGERASSPEIDFGCMWRARREMFASRLRVAWVELTGEVYATALVPRRGRVYVLGIVRSREEIERRLDGWADVCGEPGSLAWVRERLVGAIDTAGPGFVREVA